MRILAVETSCDETAVAVLDGAGDERSARFTVRGDALLSQIEIHKEYGGVFPAVAKREHAAHLVPLLEAALEEAELLHEDTQAVSEAVRNESARLLAREPGLDEQFQEFIAETEPPAVDAIAVTAGPGLEPALWVGVNFAKALALAWGKPLVAVNHLEGHVLAALAKQRAPGSLELADAQLPILALLISGGHTELVLMKEWLSYELVGQTRDDAVGEAFDKVARMLGLPYPGGPEISRLAESLRSEIRTSDVLISDRTSDLGPSFRLPRPMIDSGTCDFSFAGLKTAVRYALESKSGDAAGGARGAARDVARNASGDAARADGMIYHTGLSEREKIRFAREFEDAVADVLWAKTARALRQTQAKTLVIGGGVSANVHIRRVFKEKIASLPGVELRIPAASLTTDNAVMIGVAGYFRALKKEFAAPQALAADGNLALAK